MRAFCDRITALVFALGLLIAVAVPVPSVAGPYEDALAGFTTDDFTDTFEAIDGVVASGNPLAAQLLEALQDSRLQFSAAEKKVFIKTKDGALLDAATGQPALARRPPISRTSASTTGCVARSMARSAR